MWRVGKSFSDATYNDSQRVGKSLAIDVESVKLFLLIHRLLLIMNCGIVSSTTREASRCRRLYHLSSGAFRRTPWRPPPLVVVGHQNGGGSVAAHELLPAPQIPHP
jgi:hypothetical protein